MSQHDMVIDNQDRPSFRADLNAALTALASNSSGSTRPASPVTNQFWIDTDTAAGNILYFFDGADDIPLLVIDKTGNAARPATKAVLEGGTTAGTGTAQTATVAPPLTAYATGQLFMAAVGVTNTGGLTLDFGPGAKTVKDRAGSALAAGAWRSGATHLLRYNGTDLIVLTELGRGVGGWDLIEAKTASASATLDFTTGLDGTYDAFLFDIEGLLPANDGETLLLRVSEDAGGSWKAGAADYEYNLVRQISATADFVAVANSQGATSIPMANASVGNQASDGGVFGEVKTHKPAGATSPKLFLFDLTYFDNSATPALFRTTGVGAYNGTVNAINGVRFLFLTGAITSGVVRLYGRRK